MTAGIIQGLGAMGFLIQRFLTFSWMRAGIIGDPVDTPSNMPEVNANYGTGVFAMAEFIMQPLHMLLLYLACEGIVRLLAAFISHQVIGSLPLYLPGWVHGLFDKAVRRRYMGARVVDEIVRHGVDLVVHSSRPKLHWNPYMTIEYEGEFYQMLNEGPSTKPRRFAFYLRKNPVGRVVVTIDHYKIDEVLKAPPREAPVWQQMWEDMGSKLKRKGPAVEDLVIHGGARQGYDLKVYSCRPKPDWNSYVAIEFEDVFYELLRHEAGPKPREFVFFLRKAPLNKPASVVRHYKTDDVLKG